MLVIFVSANESGSVLGRYSTMCVLARIISTSWREDNFIPQERSRNPFGSSVMDTAHAESMPIITRSMSAVLQVRGVGKGTGVIVLGGVACVMNFLTLPWQCCEHNHAIFLENPQGAIL